MMLIGNIIKRISSTKRIYTNLVTNFSFEDGLTNWTLYVNTGLTVTAATDQSYLGSKSYKATSSSNSVGSVYRQAITFTNGRKYYMFCYGRSTSTNGNPVGMRIYSNTTQVETSYVTLSSETLNTWLRSSGTIRTSNGAETHVAVVIGQSASNTGWVDALYLVDLTAEFGAGNEPNLSWCEANISELNFA